MTAEAKTKPPCAQVKVRLPVELKEEIARSAEADRRTVSSQLQTLLERALAEGRAA